MPLIAGDGRGLEQGVVDRFLDRFDGGQEADL
jgi:hypothetical protein